MRVAFMGTPAFAVPSLEALASATEVVAVYTRPDSVSGRGSGRRPSPVKEKALELGLPVVQPVTLRDAEEQGILSGFAPDLVVVAAYGLILPAEVLSIPRFGCVNVHASLLPRWRGAAPIQRAILAGDPVTGVSIMRMEEGLDTGPYCEVEAVDVDEKSSSVLAEELAEAGARALLRTVRRLESGQCEWAEQDEAAVTYAEKISKSDVALSPDLPLREALLRVRASSPQAPARLRVAGKGITVVSATSSAESLQPGRVLCGKHELLLGFADGTMSAERVKPDGRGEMGGCDWARGARLSAGEWERLG